MDSFFVVVKIKFGGDFENSALFFDAGNAVKNGGEGIALGLI